MTSLFYIIIDHNVTLEKIIFFELLLCLWHKYNDGLLQ